MSPWVWLGIAVLGGTGAVVRFLLDTAVARRTTTPFPLGIFVVNVSGAFALGVVDGAVLPAAVATVVGTGLIGAYTTFSTWMLQTRVLMVERHWTLPVLNVVLSVLAGLAAAVWGTDLGARL